MYLLIPKSLHFYKYLRYYKSAKISVAANLMFMRESEMDYTKMSHDDKQYVHE